MSDTLEGELETEALSSGPPRREADLPDRGRRLLLFASTYGTLVFLGALLILFTVLSEIILGDQRFLTGANLSLVLRQSAVLAILAGGLTVVLLLGEFDLSIAATMTLGGAMFAQFAQGSYVFTWPTIPFTDVGGGAILGSSWQANAIFALCAALLFGLVVGLLNGVIVAQFGVTAFIATLGMAGIIDGYLVKLTDGRSVPLPKGVTDAAQGTVLGWKAPSSWSWVVEPFGKTFEFNLVGLSIPSIALAAAAVLFVLWVFLNHTEGGRRMDAVGGNAEGVASCGDQCAALPDGRLRHLCRRGSAGRCRVGRWANRLGGDTGRQPVLLSPSGVHGLFPRRRVAARGRVSTFSAPSSGWH